MAVRKRREVFGACQRVSRGNVSSARLAGVMILFGLLAWGTPLPALASSGGPGAVEGETLNEEDGLQAETLTDDVLEYGELQAMIRNYNPTMEEAWSSYNRTLKEYADASEVLKFGQLGAYTDKKDAENSGDAEQSAYYASEEEIYRSAASTYYSMYDNMQSAASTSSMRQTERRLTAAAQSLMISYETMRLEADTAGKMQELYEAEYNLALAGVQAGTATEADVLKARDNVLAAQSTLASARSAMESVYDSLCLMVGRETDGSLTVASIPEADAGRIASMSLEADTRKAIGNNATLINERHASAESSTSGSENKKRATAESEEKLTIKMKGLYQDVLQKKEERDTAKTAYENAGLKKQAADAKYRAGLISQSEYLSAEMEYIQQTAGYKAADLALQQAMDTYDWAVLGLAEIG